MHGTWRCLIKVGMKKYGTPLSTARLDAQGRFVRLASMNALTFDTLKYANKLKTAGFTPEQAEAQASIIFEVLEANRQELATKGDLSALKNELKNDIAILKTDIEKLRLEMKADSEKTKAEIIKWNVATVIAAVGLAMAIARIFFHS